ncbi:MAG: carboxylating nicotinate-nucleotide diphosphorylase [Kiritimatiellaeota bacterium]|nr:carboxylating nicotinate-nucleotide diphosphorylase [Kiritimatiellota bacterium]
MNENSIDWRRVGILIELSLEEDLEKSGDTTSLAVIPGDLNAKARLVAKRACVVAGLHVAEAVFKAVDESLEFSPLVADGDHVEKSAVLAEISGKAISLLTAERTALNFFQRLSGVATQSARYASAVARAGCVILDTRKTTPGWRNLEKYAVAVGGASNHRIGLYDRIMIKDNHRELAGLDGPNGITRSVEKARTAYPELEIEVEADTLDQVREAVEAGADYVLLDNMDNDTMRKAVELNAGRAKLEASGGITFERLAEIAALGVDFISVGALTHSVEAADISMETVL